MRLYTIKDTVAGRVGPVFEAVNDQVAQRQFVSAISKSPYVTDFDLLYVADIDECTGQVSLSPESGSIIPTSVVPEISEEK